MKGNAKIIVILLVAIAIIVAIFMFTRKDTEEVAPEQQHLTDEEIIASFGIDVNDEAYAGKKIYVEDGDVIIENEDGSKTIESRKEEETDLKEATDETKSQYEITDVKVNIDGSRTSITGKITNNTKDKHKVLIGGKFYSQDNKVKGSGNTQIDELKSKETQRFEIIVMGDMTGYTHKVEVEFTN